MLTISLTKNLIQATAEIARENFHLIRVFEIFEYDEMLDDVFCPKRESDEQREEESVRRESDRVEIERRESEERESDRVKIERREMEERESDRIEIERIEEKDQAIIQEGDITWEDSGRGTP